MAGKKDQNSIKRRIFVFILCGLAFKLVRRFFAKNKKIAEIKRNCGKFLHEEKEEFKDWAEGKEHFCEYCHDSYSIFHDYFIPNAHNGHKPKVLRTKSLATIVLLAVMVKAMLTGYLFFVHPNEGKMDPEMIPRVLELINRDREAQGLEALSMDSSLCGSAQAKAEDMSIHNYFAHYSPDGKKPWDFVDRVAYRYTVIGENLAMNFYTADAAHNALMESPTHRKNIMNAKYKEVGLAIVSGEIDGKTTNILVQMFGAKDPAEYKVAASVPASVSVAAPVVTPPVETAVAPKPVAPVQPAAPVPAVKPAESKPAPVEPVKPNPEVSAPQPEQAIPAPATTQPETGIASETAPADETVAESEEMGGNGNIGAGTEVDIMHTASMLKSDPAGIRTVNFSDGMYADDTAFPAFAGTTDEGPMFIAAPDSEVRFYAPRENPKIALAARIAAASRWGFLGVLVFLTLALSANIIIRIRFQHKPVIVQSMLTIVLLVGLVSVRIHILERVAELVAVV